METHPSLTDQISPLLTDLYYPSESDEPVELISCYLDQPEPLTVSQIKDWQMVPPEVYVDEIPEEQFWQPVITEQDWYDDTEKARTKRFQQLKQVLEQHLTDRQVFRVGTIEVDLLLIGKQANGERVGIKTKVIET
ncbi:nuclease [Fibrisoma montanum]|uniref:Nuclease n=1 Tax=Fibrisoma montanum TaxID=2305895 RepID=A0A418MAS7_9BACT|nr:nuclease A inhibitor family protein [Fibrisoma montanum]RIV23478.1 nuclease [Fibrisoma montanum]